jgi:hypothetical protein
MNLKISAVALALSLACVSSFAANPAWPSPQDEATPSTRNRAQVQAELAQAQAAGELSIAHLAYGVPGRQAAPVRSADVSRAQVRNAVEAARARGELDIGYVAWGAPRIVHGDAPHALMAAESAARGN